MGTAERIERRRLLAVDDEPDVLRLIECLFEDRPDLHIDTVTTYEEAHARLRSDEPDLAILDVMGVRGDQLLAEFGARLPCIILTARATAPDDFFRCFHDQAALYLPKSSMGDLPECVDLVLAEIDRSEEERGGAALKVLAPEARQWLWRWLLDRLHLFGLTGEAVSTLATRSTVATDGQRGLPTFEGLAAGMRRELSRRLWVGAYEAGKSLFQAGQPCEALHIVVSGELELLRGGEGGEVVAVAGPGSILCETSLFLPDTHTLTARASRAAVVASLHHQAFQELIRERGEVALPIAMNIGRALIQMLRSTRAAEARRAKTPAAPEPPLTDLDRFRYQLTTDWALA